MPALRDHLPLAIVTIALSVAVFILFKEVKAAKDQALIGARFATSFQEQQQQLLVMPQPAFMEDPAPAAQPTVQPTDPRPEARRVTIKEEIEEIPDEPPARKPSSKRS